MKLNINSGKKGSSNYTFSPISLVTLDFGRLQPTRTFSMIPSDKFPQIQANGLLRCTPQIFPPFGRMNVKSAAFFVPDSQIFSWSIAFHSDNQQWRGQLADSVPVFQHYDINFLFTTSNIISGLSTVVASNPTTPPALNTYDFTFPETSSRSANSTNLRYYRLTPLGWKLYSIFKSLGYDFVIFPTDFNLTYTGWTGHAGANSSYISAVPFLAYAKIWNDYFCNSYQSDNNIVAEYLQKIYLNKDIVISGTTVYNSSNFHIDFTLCMVILKELQLPYESNMYTNAWNNPNDPTGVENARLNQVNTQSLISPFGRSSDGEFRTLVSGTDGNTHGTSVNPGQIFPISFSQLGHRTLQAFDRFVRRRNLVGSKAVQQLYALLGYELDESKIQYCFKLAESSSRVNFSAITSQSDTENGAVGKPLGAFAGVGLAGYNLDFSYNAGTYGTLICLSWLNIDPILMHGLSPDVLRVKPLDFYNPDFDGNAYRPIPYCEITGAKSIGVDGYQAISVYGYTNMYDDYRMQRDLVAGNFCDDTTSNFAFIRDLSETRRQMAAFALDMYPQTEDVQYWHIDGNSDLTNPFITSPSAGDRFWFCIDWNIKCNRPILSNENAFNLDGEGSLTINKNGDGMA